MLSECERSFLFLLLEEVHFIVDSYPISLCDYPFLFVSSLHSNFHRDGSPLEGKIVETLQAHGFQVSDEIRNSVAGSTAGANEANKSISPSQIVATLEQHGFKVDENARKSMSPDSQSPDVSRAFLVRDEPNICICSREKLYAVS